MSKNINYLTQMEKELKKLDHKIGKLNIFINAEDSKFNKLIKLDQELLIAQINSMYAYRTILSLRLDLGYGK